RREPFNYCAAVNAGAERATGDLWIISNNDIEWRSEGDLNRVRRIFLEWPLVAVLSPGRATGTAELEFLPGGINGVELAREKQPAIDHHVDFVCAIAGRLTAATFSASRKVSAMRDESGTTRLTMPSSSARSTSSIASDAPRRNEKGEVTPSST
ncbi:MAG: hypothetical protein ABR582_17665, partial [Gemmatimonadaceae bacterium]